MFADVCPDFGGNGNDYIAHLKREDAGQSVVLPLRAAGQSVGLRKQSGPAHALLPFLATLPLGE